MSLTVAAVTLLGPLFVTVIVYVTLVPGTALSWLSVLVMDRSAWGVSVSVSVALLLAVLGSVTPAGGATVAVLASAAGRCRVDGGRDGVGDRAADRDAVTVSLMLPLPDGVVAGDAGRADAGPGDAGEGGREGVGHEASVAVLGPALVTTMV